MPVKQAPANHNHLILALLLCSYSFFSQRLAVRFLASEASVDLYEEFFHSDTCDKDKKARSVRESQIDFQGFPHDVKYHKKSFPTNTKYPLKIIVEGNCLTWMGFLYIWSSEVTIFRAGTSFPHELVWKINGT